MKRDLQNFDAKNIIEKISELPGLLQEQLKMKNHYIYLAKKYSQYNNFFYL